MTGKIPAWWENYGCGIRKTAGKNSDMVENFPLGEIKRLLVHGNSGGIRRVGGDLPLPFVSDPDSIGLVQGMAK
jgi:hypothetical protein